MVADGVDMPSVDVWIAGLQHVPGFLDEPGQGGAPLINARARGLGSLVGGPGATVRLDAGDLVVGNPQDAITNLWPLQTR